MKKMKKLLSVLLAVVISLSCMSVMASAAKTSYQTVDNLETLGAYSPYGTVTRLSSEERTSIFADFLDNLLRGLNLNLGDISLLSLATIKLNFTSVDNVLASLDSFAGLSTVLNLVGGLLGDLKDLELGTWQEGMTRDTYAQEEILFEIFELLANNTSLVNNILTTGLQLGIVTSFMAGIDLSGLNQIVTNLAGFAKGMILPLFERWDDTAAEAVAMEGYQDGTSSTPLTTVFGEIIGNYFQKPMSLTTVKADSTGNITSGHTLPGDLSASTHRRIYVQNGTEIVVYQYYFQTDVDKSKTDKISAVGYGVVGTYTLQKENGTDDYVFVMTKDSEGKPVENGETIKYYQPGSYWLPSFVEDGGSIDITSETGANLLYKMIPYVFDEMVPVVANGSLKKLLAQFFGTQFTYVGDVGSAEVTALADASNTFFTEPQGEYLWEWSNYAVINGTHYYRFEDQIFVGDTSKANEYMNIINWDYEITSDLLTKYIPATYGATSTAGYTKILHGINDFLIDLATEVADLDVLGVSFTKGDNTNLAENLRKAAKAVLSYHPEHIFGSGYADPNHYYNLIISDDINQVLTGVAALAVDGLAPQMILPGAVNLEEQGVKVGAIGAAMLRELATQLLPHYNYDGLIYSDYSSKTFLKDKTNEYWLDVIVTMGVDIGMKYLHNLADMNEDTTAWKNLGYGSESMTTPVTYTEASFDQTGWEDKVDYILDWALTVTTDGSILTWNMANLVGSYVTEAGYTIDLATAQDPWTKIDAIFDGILFFDQFTSETNLEEGLRGTIEDLLNLNLGAILGTASDPAILDVPSTSRLVTESLLSALSLEVRDLINGLFKQVGGGSYYFIPTSVTTIDGLLSNISTIATNLVAALDDAVNNGLIKTLLPILNIFVGWTTDPQKYATPTITLSSGANYVYDDASDGSATVGVTVTNNAAGMLLKHRANIKSDGTFSAVEDKPYILTVKSIVCDVAGTTFDQTTYALDPYAYTTFTATVPFTGGNVVAKFTITYEFTQGKDGNAVGGENVIDTYVLISNVAVPYLEGRQDGDDNTAYSMINTYNQYVPTQDLYTTVTTQTATIMHYVDTLGSIFGSDYDTQMFAHWVQEAAMAENSATYFENLYPTGITGGVTEESHMPQEVKDGGWLFKWGGNEDEINRSTTGTLFKAKDGVTADTVFDYGIYDMGTVNVGYKACDANSDCAGGYKSKESDGKFFLYKFIYYTKFGAEGVMSDYVGKQLRADDFSASAQDEFVTYEAALKEVVKYAQYPVTTDFTTTIQLEIEDAIAALDAAYNALMEAEDGASGSAESADIAEIEALIATDDGDGEKEINFQDYDLFEYWGYEKYRTNLRNVVKAAQAPAVLDEYYIKGSGISYDELSNDVIPGAANETIKTAITASMTQRDADEVAASQAAHDDFVAPHVEEIYLDDQAARFTYYKQFLLPIAADTSFLAKEKAFVDYWMNAGEIYEARFTADSWARAVEAYTDASNAINGVDADGAAKTYLPSEIFSIKYELMVAVKNLLIADANDTGANTLGFAVSANANGATADLLANIEIANSILAMDLSEIKLSQVAIDKGLTVEEALGHLIYGLGYEYTGRDGVEYDLYADSALEYAHNDRPNVSTNTARIDKCNENLEACIAYFDIAVAAPELGAVDGTTGVVGETTDVDGVATGYIYGITVGGTIDETFALVDDSAGYTKNVASTLIGASETGTGAKVQVYNNSDVLVAEYTLIVFGDVNGDGGVTGVDLMSVSQYASGTTSVLAGDALVAADVNADGSATGVDLMSVSQYASGTTSAISQTVGIYGA